MPEFYFAPTPVDRKQIAWTSQGIVSEVGPMTTSNGAIPTANAASGQLVASLIGLRAGKIVHCMHLEFIPKRVLILLIVLGDLERVVRALGVTNFAA